MTKGHEIPTIDVAMVTASVPGGSEIALQTASKIAVSVQTETQDAVKLVVKGKLISQKPETVTITGNTITLTDNVFIPELVKILQGGTITMEKTYTYTASAAVTTGNYYFQLSTTEYLNFTLSTALADGDELEYSTYTQQLVATIAGVESVISSTLSSTSSGTVLAATSADGDHVVSYTPPVAGSSDKGEIFTLNAYSAIYDASGEITGYEKIMYPNCQGTPVALNSEDNVFRAPEYTINSAPKNGEAPYCIDYIKSLPTIV